MRISIEGGWVDLSTREVHRGGVTAQLRHKEAELLGYLAGRMGQVVPREELLAEVWGYHPDSRSRTLDTTVRRIRAQIEPEPGSPRQLLTAPGTGYRLMDAPGPSDEVARLLVTLQQAPIVALWGPAGVGKSFLARRLRARWEGPVLAELSPQVPAGALVVLDPCPEDIELDELVSWASRQGGARILLCCRSRPRHPGVSALPVLPLSTEAAWALYAGAAALVGEPNQPALLEPLAGLPAALLLVAPLGETLGSQVLGERLAASATATLRAAGGGALIEALEQSVARLPEELRPALQRLAALPLPVRPELASAVVGEPSALTALLDEGVVGRDESGRLRVLPLLREPIGPLPAEVRTAAGEAVAAFCAQRIHPFMGPRTSEERQVLIELDPLLEALAPDSAHAEHMYALACRQAARQAPLLEGAPPLLRAHLGRVHPEQGLALIEPLPPSTERSIARVRLLRQLGRLEEALAAPLPDELHGLLAGEWAYQLYLAQRYLGNWAETERWAARALQEWTSASDLAVTARLALGDVGVLRGELSQAETAYASVVDDPGDPVRRSDARFGLGRVALMRYDAETSRLWVERALEDLAELTPRTAAHARFNAAVLLREGGALARARQLILDGLELALVSQLAPIILQRMRMVLGSVLLELGEYDEALATLFRVGELEEPRNIALLSAAYTLAGQPREARPGVERALELVRDRFDRDGHWVRVLCWAVLGRADPEDLAAVALFAAQTYDPALTASVAVLSGKEPDPRTLGCSSEARLVRLLDRCHTSSHRREPDLR